MNNLNNYMTAVPKLTIIQKLQHGFLGGPFSAHFSCSFHDKKFHISTNQLLIRTTDISCETTATINDYWLLFNLIDELVMLFEGTFVPISEISFQVEDPEIIHTANALMCRRLKMYSSADFMEQPNSFFLSFTDNITDSLFQKWQALSKELEIIHSMFLYNISDVEYPIDLKCAHLIEIFEPLVTVINFYNPTFLNAYNNPARLRSCIDSVISEYGKDIFQKEYSINKDKFLSFLVWSRHRIMHIKRKQQSDKFLSGPESFIYCIKLACLYRNVLLQLLCIDYSKYKDKLSTYIDKLNNHEHIVNNFITQKLNT